MAKNFSELQAKMSPESRARSTAMARIILMPPPGDILTTEFLVPMGITINALSKAIRVSRSRIDRLCKGKQDITPELAARLGKFFAVDPKWFLNLQTEYQAEQLKNFPLEELDLIKPYDPADFVRTVRRGKNIS